MVAWDGLPNEPAAPLAEISLDEQVKAVGREIGLRKAVYPKLIGSGRMAEAAAAIEIRRMEAVYATLKKLQGEESLAKIVRAQLGEAIHTGLRKASNHDEAHKAWMAIRALPSEEWSNVVEFALNGMGVE